MLLTGNRPFRCRDYGWPGRRNWTDADLRKLLHYGAGGAETDPALDVLDEQPAFPVRWEHQNARATRESIYEWESERFYGDLDPIDQDQIAVDSGRSESLAPT